MVLLFVMAAALPARGQNQRITMPGGEMTVQEILARIGTQAGYMFIVRDSRLDTSRKVTVPSGDAGVDELLGLVLQGSGKTWLMDNRHIIIPVDVNGKPTQRRNQGGVRGVVSDGSGNPLKGAGVEVIGKGRTTVTDANGCFSIEIAPGTHILKFSSGDVVRYREAVVTGGRTVSMDIVLAEPETPEAAVPVLLEADPVKPPESRTSPQHEAAMPAAGTYAFVELDEPARSYRPKAALKTNLLYLATTTPNVGLEFALAKRWSFNTHFGYNAWNFGEQRGMKHWVVQPEVRFWFCNAFERGFLGLHGIYGRFNIQNMELPFTDAFAGYRYKGYAAGVGLAWGYHLPIGKRWGMEFSIGAGYVYLEYDKLRCGSCEEFEGRHYRHYIGPTKASVSMIFMIK